MKEGGLRRKYDEVCSLTKLHCLTSKIYHCQTEAVFVSKNVTPYICIAQPASLIYKTISFVVYIKQGPKEPGKH